MSARWLVFFLAVSVLLGGLAERPAGAVEHNFAGSAQLDYHFVPTEPGANANAGTNRTFDGFTVETALKVAVDISDHVSANVKACYGCHGLELDMAYFDVRATDELNIRLGRFSPSFGAFNLRHDPANHKLSDKPLPYDMGRMLRKGLDQWNNGVLPSPFPDNGLEINGTHWFGEVAQLDYAVYAVTGFKNSAANPADFNFAESHTPYYVDNNGRPTLGGRAALTIKATSASDVTLGASGMYGTYDTQNKLTYAIVGADLSVRLQRTNLRIEYLLRRQDMDTTLGGNFKYAVSPTDGDFFSKHGAFAELEAPVTRDLDLILRVDGMLRVGNVLASSQLSSRSSVVRETLGFAYAIDRSFRLKASTELWQFSDADATGKERELSFHLGGVGSF